MWIHNSSAIEVSSFDCLHFQIQQFKSGLKSCPHPGLSPLVTKFHPSTSFGVCHSYWPFLKSPKFHTFLPRRLIFSCYQNNSDKRYVPKISPYRMSKITICSIFVTTLFICNVVVFNKRDVTPEALPGYLPLESCCVLLFDFNLLVYLMNHLLMIILILCRFCHLETSCEQDDNFPANICVEVNGKLATLPVSYISHSIIFL